jgi:hypothetical protein
MYNNIPKLEVINIIENLMKNDPEITKTDQEEITKTLNSIMVQNYFQFNRQY